MADLHADAKAIAEQLGHELGIKNLRAPVPWSIFAAIVGGLKAATLEQHRQIAALESRLATIESKGVEFCGTWQRAVDYRRGSMIVHKGSLWAATDASHGAVPGESPIWQLAAKAGRDAR